jgi:hypothetical protein
MLMRGVAFRVAVWAVFAPAKMLIEKATANVTAYKQFLPVKILIILATIAPHP